MVLIDRSIMRTTTVRAGRVVKVDEGKGNVVEEVNPKPASGSPKVKV